MSGGTIVEQDEEKIRTIVKIANQTYTVIGKESSDHVREASELVDTKMKQLRESNPYLTSTQLAVLAALNISNEYVSLKRQQENETKDEDGTT